MCYFLIHINMIPLKSVFVTDSHLLLCVLLVALERKISMRQSREELIKRGVLKEIYDKGKGNWSPLQGPERHAYFLKLDSVCCITLSGFEPFKLLTVLERKENFADRAKALRIILAERNQAPLFSPLEQNHGMLWKMMWPQEWCGFLVGSLWVFEYTQPGWSSLLGLFRALGPQDKC